MVTVVETAKCSGLEHGLEHVIWYTVPMTMCPAAGTPSRQPPSSGGPQSATKTPASSSGGQAAGEDEQALYTVRHLKRSTEYMRAGGVVVRYVQSVK